MITLDKKYIKLFRDYPHKLGHFLGYKDLRPFHDEWIKHCWGGTGTRTLQAHRNSYKTSAIIIVGAVWWILFHPNISILLTRKTSTNSSSIITTIIKHLDSKTLCVPSIQKEQ